MRKHVPPASSKKVRLENAAIFLPSTVNSK